MNPNNNIAMRLRKSNNLTTIRNEENSTRNVLTKSSSQELLPLKNKLKSRNSDKKEQSDMFKQIEQQQKVLLSHQRF